MSRDGDGGGGSGSDKMEERDSKHLFSV